MAADGVDQNIAMDQGWNGTFQGKPLHSLTFLAIYVYVYISKKVIFNIQMMILHTINKKTNEIKEYITNYINKNIAKKK